MKERISVVIEIIFTGILLGVIFATPCFADNEMTRYEVRVKGYLIQQGISNFNDAVEFGIEPVKKQRTILKWKLVGGVPTDDKLPEYSEDLRQQVETIQQTGKSQILKKAENKLIMLYRNNGIMASNDVHVVDAHIKAAHELIIDLPEAQAEEVSNEHQRLWSAILKLGGEETDVYWHDDI